MLNIIRRNRDFFEDFFDDLNVNNHLMKSDVLELENSYQINIDLPGFKKEDVKVSMDDKYLVVEASRTVEEKEEDEKTKYLRQERYYGSLKRRFYVGNVTLDNIKGEFKDGVLTILIDKNTKEIEKKYLEL